MYIFTTIYAFLYTLSFLFTYMKGSYDHTVKMWDVRQEHPINSILLQHPVQYTMFTQSGTMLLTASGSQVQVYDLISGGKLLHTFNNHQKHVTSLCLDESRYY